VADVVSSCRWLGQFGACVYSIPGVLQAFNRARRRRLSGLPPAGTYQFQVRALGKLGYTDWSPSMTFISA